MISLTQLAIYPVKSTAQISLNTADISPFGLSMDRRWMIIDSNGQMLTQRKYANMCLIKSAISNNTLTLSAPAMPPLTLPLNISASEHPAQLKATVWNDTCNAYNCGTEAAGWLSDFLNTPARLVFFPQHEIRQVDLTYARTGDTTAFSDGFPYLLITQASLDDLNSRLTTPVEMKRFRPNLVVSGTVAFAEDSWKKIRIGDTLFNVVKPCSRCAIPGINPQTAEKTAEPLKTLAGYRLRDNNIYFGQNVIAEGSGVLTVGMEVEVLE